MVAAATAVLALAVNAFRPGGLPLVARVPYEVLVPCPEPGGEVVAIAAGDPAVASSRTFLIDARTREEVRAAPVLAGAVNVPYDWLDPLPDGEMMRLARSIAASGARQVVVFGDGGKPDSGEHLGREISGRGIKSVGFVRGGAPALHEWVRR